MTSRNTWIAVAVMALAIGAAVIGLHRAASRSARAESAQLDAVDHEPKQVAGDNLDDVARRDVTFGSVAKADDDTLLLSYAADPESLNPITSADVASEDFQRLVYETLANESYRDPDKYLPGLAEKWEFDAKTLTYTLHLRHGVKWHPVQLPNGDLIPAKPFTARDVKFSFDCVLNKHIEASSIRNYYEDADAKDEAERCKIRVTVVDDYTVKVRWTKPYFLAKEFTLAGFPIFPEHVFSVDENGEPISADYSSKEFADGFNNHWGNKVMCGTGPMMFQRWQRNERLTLERNPDYWGRPYYFSQLVFRCIPNPNTSVEMVLHNDLDFTLVAQKDRYFQLFDEPAVKNKEVVPRAYDYPGYRFITWNIKKEFFKDKRVRMAMAHAVPVQQIIDHVLQGLGKPMTGPFMPGSSVCDASIKPIPFDLAAARGLLEEAGWIGQGDGLRHKAVEGKDYTAGFDLMLLSESSNYKIIAEMLHENCRKLGVQVHIVPVEWSLLLSKLNKKQYDAAILGWALSWKDDPYQIFHGSQADVLDSSNSGGYRNPEVDHLIEELRVTLDEKKQIELYHKIHRLIHDDQPLLFLYTDVETSAFNSRLMNTKFYKIRPCYDTTEWYSRRSHPMAE